MGKGTIPGLIEEIRDGGWDHGTVALWSLGNMGFVLKGPRSRGALVFDPYLTHSIEVQHPGTEFVRAFPPPLMPEDLAEVDTLLITHEHDDHLDLETLARAFAVRPDLRVVVPEALEPIVRSVGPQGRIVAAREGVELDLGFRVTPVAAAHPVAERDAQDRSMRLGYLVELNGVRVFHAGDTVVHPGLVADLERLRPEVALLPINGGDYFRTARGIVANMSARDAVELAAHIGVDLLVGAHFDLFPNNRDRPSGFLDHLFEAHPGQKFHLFTVGERLIYQRSNRSFGSGRSAQVGLL